MRVESERGVITLLPQKLEKPIEKKYREGKLKRTLKREFKST